MRKEGIGSYFHFENPEDFKNEVSLDFDYQLFYTGRHALLYILNDITSSRSVSNIWFPEYYCQHTLHWIKTFYPFIQTHSSNPFEFNNDMPLDVLDFATANDVVLINKTPCIDL